MSSRWPAVVTVTDPDRDDPCLPTGFQAPLPGLRPPGFVAASDLIRRGWTDAMIRELLGTADATARNPHCTRGHPMRLYADTRIALAERGPSFQDRLATARRNRLAGQAAAHRRRDALLAWVDTLRIVAPPIAPSRLDRICTDYFGHLSETDLGSLPFVLDRALATCRLTQRVVYLALQMACHEDALAPFIGAPGYPEAIAAVRLRILDAIAVAYPDLRDAVRGVRLRRVDREALLQESVGPAACP